ncbi:type III secretion system leucine-rich repeat domain-containing effector XopL [Xanthomonas graminis]|uniref:Putative type III effector protein n=1 Tax=Xanthomonas graminis pv. phlei TaxID=487906 RepID=A0A0K3A5N4_9XANT|nr:type III secretion system leucine-rich repeat domain-containing effector XopL [Xanthomonas translucens]CTP93143.1 putative type III effector protein [Xanthomonas translucens pv. phlei]
MRRTVSRASRTPALTERCTSHPGWRTLSPLPPPSQPSLRDIERGRFHVNAGDSSHPVANRLLNLQLEQWVHTCLESSTSWKQDWEDATRNIHGIPKNPPESLQATATALKTAARPHSDSLKINYSALPHFPSDLSHFTHLKRIDIKSAGLKSLPESIGAMRNLRELKLINNPVTKLPESLRDLSKLQSLEIVGCKRLERLPASLISIDYSGLHGLTTLRNLSLHGSGLRHVPDCVTHMYKLERLDLGGLPLMVLPRDISNLKKLRELNLERTNIQELQPTVCELRRLKKLALANCTQLRALPQNLGQLQELEELNLRGCHNLTALPESIRQLPGTCNISVPRHLEDQLNRLRPEAASRAREIARYAASSSNSAADPSRAQSPQEMEKAIAREKIDERAYAALTLIENGKNPFMKGNPPFNQELENTGRRMTLGEIPGIQTLVEESNNPQTRSILLGRRGLVMTICKGAYDTKADAVNFDNLNRALNMWRQRERIIIAEPSFRTHFPELELHITEQTQTGEHTDP